MNYWDKTMGSVEQAKGYIRSYGEGVGFPSRMETLRWIKDNESFLDVGCGSGCEYENIKAYNRNIDYKGVDYSQTFIQACQELFPEAIWELQDANNLQEKDNSFDTVLLRHILEHCEYYEQPIKEAWRVAKKRIIIVFWVAPSKNSDIDKLDKVGEDCWHNIYSYSKLLQFLKTFTNKITIKEKVGKDNMVIIAEK